MRLIHAVRDLNAEHPDADPITVIALYTDAERTAMFAREADEAYPLGPASERPYLNHDLLAKVLTEVRADAVWVGWGFVAEDAAFADRMAELGITFIGPSGDAMRSLGDKIGSKLLAEEAGVPVAPWSNGGVHTLDEALEAVNASAFGLQAGLFTPRLETALTAFDRLEVSEATARSIILSKDIGPIVHITEDEKQEINEAFGLK